MGLLFILLAVIAIVIFLALPFWAAVGFLVVFGWTAFLIYLIFLKSGPVSQAIEEYRE